MANRASRGFLSLSLIIIVFMGMAGAPIATAQSPLGTSTAPVLASQHTTITQTFTYEALPETPGSVELTVSYDFPDSLTAFTLGLPSDTTSLRERSGFSQTNPGVYEWDGYTDSPELTVEYHVNETTRANRGYRFVDHHDWSLFKTTNWRATWTGTQQLSLRTHQTVSGTGATGDRLVFLGPYTTKQYSTTNEELRFIIPDAAEPTADFTDAASLLDRTSTTLDVGPRSKRLTIIIAPTDTVEWGLGGVQVGTSDFLVADTQSLTDPSNTWIHEYAHTRQRFGPNTTPKTTWLTEATAEYYGVHLSYQYEHVTYPEFTRTLERGSARRYADVELSRQSTWAGTNADYHVGALVIAALDQTIREETNGTHTFQDVFHALNTHTGPIDHATFRDIVTDVGGQPAGTAVDRYVTTTTRPTLWNQPTHARVFQTTTPVITYQLPPSNRNTYQLSGPYRSTTTTDSPPVLVPNETLTIPITISNPGTRTGTYDVALSSTTRTLYGDTGRIDPGATLAITITERFTESGTYFLNTTDQSTSIEVSDPATPRVTNLSLDAQTTTDTPVTITATVSNPTTVPAIGPITITANTNPIHTAPIELAPGTTTQVTTTYAPPTPGDITIATQNHSVTLTVTDPPTPTPTQTKPDPTPTTPGFTIPLALLAVLLIHQFR